jgi:hypothetical protein
MILKEHIQNMHPEYFKLQEEEAAAASAPAGTTSADIATVDTCIPLDDKKRDLYKEITKEEK